VHGGVAHASTNNVFAKLQVSGEDKLGVGCSPPPPSPPFPSFSLALQLRVSFDLLNDPFPFIPTFSLLFPIIDFHYF
jgi:hypothetical protein